MTLFFLVLSGQKAVFSTKFYSSRTQNRCTQRSPYEDITLLLDDSYTLWPNHCWREKHKDTCLRIWQGKDGKD